MEQFPLKQGPLAYQLLVVVVDSASTAWGTPPFAFP